MKNTLVKRIPAILSNAVCFMPEEEDLDTVHTDTVPLWLAEFLEKKGRTWYLRISAEDRRPIPYGSWIVCEINDDDPGYTLSILDPAKFQNHFSVATPEEIGAYARV